MYFSAPDLDWIKVSKAHCRGGGRRRGGEGKKAQPVFAKLTSKSIGNGANFIPVQSSMMGWEVELR